MSEGRRCGVAVRRVRERHTPELTNAELLLTDGAVPSAAGERRMDLIPTPQVPSSQCHPGHSCDVEVKHAAEPCSPGRAVPSSTAVDGGGGGGRRWMDGGWAQPVWVETRTAFRLRRLLDVATSRQDGRDLLCSAALADRTWILAVVFASKPRWLALPDRAHRALALRRR